MVADAGDILDVIKKAATGAVAEAQPTRFVFGEVIQKKPLKIKISDKIILTKELLTLTRNVTTYRTQGRFGNNNFEYFTLGNELKTGDKVVLIKNAEGKGYLVLDRVVKAT